MPSQTWSPEYWRRHDIRQMPVYPDPDALKVVERRLRSAPPLVVPAEIDDLMDKMATVAAGGALVIQGGDCAETFDALSEKQIEGVTATLGTLQTLMQDLVGLPVVVIGRIAGQYAKPRSKPVERIGGAELPTYRGDIINASTFDAEMRKADPERMWHAYLHAAATLNAMRQNNGGELGTDWNVYTSHEALLLPYEEALTRPDETGRWYDGSAHFLWVGDRTRQIDGAHVEFLRGIENPLGVKVGPTLAPDDLLRLLERLDPDNRPGRITLIVRHGSEQVVDLLPGIIAAVEREARNVCWLCDPMHGNTFTTSFGRKTRHLRILIDEAFGFLRAHREAGTWPSGFHLELSGDDVTECIGRSVDTNEASLAKLYTTTCDPRLNGEQAAHFIRTLGAALFRYRFDTKRHVAA